MSDEALSALTVWVISIGLESRPLGVSVHPLEAAGDLWINHPERDRSGLQTTVVPKAMTTNTHTHTQTTEQEKLLILMLPVSQHVQVSLVDNLIGKRDHLRLHLQKHIHRNVES